MRLVAEAIASAVTGSSGARVVLAPIRHPSDVMRVVRQSRPDLVVNLCESLRRDARFEPAVAFLLERLGVPFTGSPAETLRICLDKATCNSVLLAEGVPVPPTFLARDPDRLPPGIPVPCIVKPSREDGSTGIDNSSVVRDPAKLADRVRRVVDNLRQPAVVQGFVEGRELNVALLGDPLRVVFITEIDFGRLEAGLPKIVSYASKWVPGSPEWEGSQVIAAELDAATRARVEGVARAAARAVKMRGYGRVDIRLTPEGQPFVIDVNPNCDLDPEAGFAGAGRRAGLSYEQVVWRILDSAGAGQAQRAPANTSAGHRPRRQLGPDLRRAARWLGGLPLLGEPRPF